MDVVRGLGLPVSALDATISEHGKGLFDARITHNPGGDSYRLEFVPEGAWEELLFPERGGGVAYNRELRRKRAHRAAPHVHLVRLAIITHGAANVETYLVLVPGAGAPPAFCPRCGAADHAADCPHA